MKYSEENLKNYVEKCFKDAFKTENREYKKEDCSFEYVLVKNLNGVIQLVPIINCKYNRVLRKVEYRLQNNLKKNFGFEYGNTNDMRLSFDKTGMIDFNFTQAMFKYNGKQISLSISDENTNVYENENFGECMVAFTYEKLLFHYWNLNADTYQLLKKDDEKLSLPEKFRYDWNAFKELYFETFNEKLGQKYEIICSSGMKRI